jgi:hypothetical protein
VDTRFPAATAGVAASLIRVPPIVDLVPVLTCGTFRKSFIIYLLYLNGIGHYSVKKIL